MNKRQLFYLGLKRCLDIIFSFILILILLVPLLFIYLITLIILKDNPLYTTIKIGQNKKEFKMFKFHSYKKGAKEIPGYKIKEHDFDEYRYKWGDFFRFTSIDELPQLFNILVGNMSFIGPRPGLKDNENELIIERDKLSPSSYLVKPGLTGLAVVKLKRGHDPKEKAKYDSLYVKNLSFVQDLKIFCLTFAVIFKK